MATDSKRPPPLPAPTETETNTPSELTTNLSRPGDEKSTYSIPEDGTPVTIRTRGHKATKSQTSLLIEYFEGGKSGSSGSNAGSGSRKPSVRVRLTPSKKSKGDHIQVTETKGSRKASLTRRIPLDEAVASREIQLDEGEDLHSLGSYASATEESNVSRNPIDIEIDRSHRRRRPASPLIPSAESYQPGNPSEISAIPTDSFLDGTGPNVDVKRDRSFSGVGELAAAAGAGALGAAAVNDFEKHRKGSKDRVKLTDKSSEKSERKRRPKSRTSSVSDHVIEEVRSPRRRSGRGHHESTISGAESSVLSSNLSPSHRSLDAHSMRSGASKSSINNPKLLETVEDAIRRLILPELSALKREQSKRESRRGSLTSTGTSVSREEISGDRRRSSGQREELGKDSPRHRQRRNREARHDYEEESLHSPSRESLEAYQEHDGDVVTPKRSHNLLKAAAAGAAGAAAVKGLSSLEEDRSEDRRHRDRRRRRTESARSRSLGRDQVAEEYDDDHLAPAPPMPLMSEINPSEMTRTSILSADTDRPHSASEEFATMHEVSRGGVAADLTPNRSRTSVDLQQTLGTSHANVSHGDLTALPRGKKEYIEEDEADEYGRQVPVDHYGHEEEDFRELSEPADYPEDAYDDAYYNTQDVPPPLKYVPYQAGARGLSPIPSVTEAGSDVHRRNSRSMHSASEAYSSPDKSPGHPRRSPSLDSIPSNLRSREFDQLSVEEHRLNSPGRDRQNAAYVDEQDEALVIPGQTVRGIGANPNIIHPPLGMESAVASLVDGSMLDQSVLTTGSGPEHFEQRDSTISYEEQPRDLNGRGMSPDKMSIDSRHDFGEERHATPGSRSLDQSQEVSEYEIDEHGRKVPRSRYRNSPTASEAAITAGAVGAAAAALRAAQGRKQATVEDVIEEEYQPVGVSRNKSFKERTLEGWEPRNTPAHSVDRLEYEDAPKLGTSGLPDMSNPMPEIGYVDDELQTNPSVVQGRLDGQEHDFDRDSGKSTPMQHDAERYDEDRAQELDDGTRNRGLGITEAVGVAALETAAGMAAAHSRDNSQAQDDWQRTSDERKRDTLVTNPYGDASPIVNPALDENLLGARGLGPSYNTRYQGGSPGFGQRYDEGYMSNGANRTPDIEATGKAVGFSGPANAAGVDDPFYVSKGDTRHLSGMSQGMDSPFYDAATGAGIERIESKDIMALMQHLMVRDAQRSARDTELVALLMSSAVEMRNSFREMKDMIQDNGDDIIFSNVENTEKLQKAMSGPRPYPGAGSRSLNSSQAGTLESNAAKKKNLWRRALEGLSAKGTSDLSRIEDMLMQLLGEVDVLKTQTAPQDAASGPGRSFENLQPEEQFEQDRGYEPEGVSTASHASHSGHFSLNQPRGLANERKFSDNRISTVPEHDEEYDDTPQDDAAGRVDAGELTPGLHETTRGASVPLDTPPQAEASSHFQQPLSAENTPRTDRGKRHKSSSSSGWIPKISRWSETTASSVGKAFRSGGKRDVKYEDYQPPSRSGSSLASYDEAYRHDPYGDDKLRSSFSDPNLTPAAGQADVEDAQQAAYASPEDPKYKAHRNSVNLQHPQPRPGPSHRFQTALESSAQDYDTPDTPRSADWAGSATSLNRLPPNTTRYSNSSSSAAAAARGAEYWPSPTNAQSGPPRPPKEPVDSSAAQTPPKANRMSKLQYSSSPRAENRNLSGALGVPTRRPSGPRAMTPKSPEEEAAREERRRKRDTFGTIGSGDSETF